MNESHQQDDALEATEEQLTTLRDYGVSERELENLRFDDAAEWIDELRAMREDAGRFDRG